MTTIEVYLDDGRVFEYDVANPSKAREHCDAIVKFGYRHTEFGIMEHYPAHRILKVKAGSDMHTKYHDTTRGT